MLKILITFGCANIEANSTIMLFRCSYYISEATSTIKINARLFKSFFFFFFWSIIQMQSGESSSFFFLIIFPNKNIYLRMNELFLKYFYFKSTIMLFFQTYLIFLII